MAESKHQGQFKVGDVVDGRYELRRDLGEGAAARVFEASHRFTGRRVALKLIAGHGSPKLRAELHARLSREARALASVRHPGVVDILDGGFLDDETPFIVMDLLDGRTLESFIATRGRLPVEDVVPLGAQLCLALDAAHSAGIVHRDVKPSNILIVRDHLRDEIVKIVDFGIARVETANEDKLTGVGALIGTPEYMAPEQLLALDDVGPSADVYSLGVTLFECLTGRVPYDGNYQRVLLQVCSSDAAPRIDASNGTPETLVDVVHRAMAKDRGERFASAREMLQALVAALPAARPHTELFGPAPSREAKAAPPATQRRKLVRASYVTPLRLVIGDVTIDGRTEDISTGGLLVICHQICPTEKRGTLRFALPMDGKLISIDAHVRWVRAARADDPEGPRALGVEFIDPPAEVTASIARYVSFMKVPDAK